MVGFFGFFKEREKNVKYKNIESEISKLGEQLMNGIIDLSETANKMKTLKEQLKDIPEPDGSGSDSDSDNPEKTSSPVVEKEKNTNSVSLEPAASPASTNDDKGFLANLNIFGNKKAEPEKQNPELTAEPEKQNPEPEKQQEVSSVSSESPLPRPDAVIPNKDLAMAPEQVNSKNYTAYLPNGGPTDFTPEDEKNIRGGKEPKKRKKTKRAKHTGSGKRTKKQKHNTVSNEAQTQAQTQAQAQAQA